ncbi:MAG: hypothetical protein CO030_04450, partial [Candidatus Magasanikbacteria bacterium CG_4_9_14_0_2_um_filter_42_11]
VQVIVERVGRISTDDRERLRQQCELLLQLCHLRVELAVHGRVEQPLTLHGLDTALELVEALSELVDLCRIVDHGLLVAGAAQVQAEQHEEGEDDEEADEEGTLTRSVGVIEAVHVPSRSKHAFITPRPSGSNFNMFCGLNLEKSRKQDECPTLNFSAKKTSVYSTNEPFCQATLFKNSLQGATRRIGG